MSADSDFQLASERLELSVNAVAEIARGCPLSSAFALLKALQHDVEEHGDIIQSRLGEIDAQSDREPIKWAHGRGLSGLVRVSAATFPHVWSSAHEAARTIQRLALEYFFWPLEEIVDPKEQQSTFKTLLSKSRRKALAMTMEEVADWQERIRRERAKLLSSNRIPDDGWSEAKSPAEWRKDLGKISETTLRRYVKDGKLVVDKITSKSWQVRLDTLNRFQGNK